MRVGRVSYWRSPRYSAARRRIGGGLPAADRQQVVQDQQT